MIDNYVESYNTRDLSEGPMAFEINKEYGCDICNSNYTYSVACSLLHLCISFNQCNMAVSQIKD